MSLLDRLVSFFGKRKVEAFKAISIVNLVSTMMLLLYFIGLIVYYTWPNVGSINDDDTSFESTVKMTRKVQSSPGAGLFFTVFGIMIAFPAGQLLSVTASIIWVVQNFERKSKVLRKISMFGSVLQVLIGLVAIIIGISFSVLAPILSMVLGVSAAVIALFEVWWIVVAVFCFAQNKWLNNLELRGVQSDYERTEDVEQLEDEPHL